MNYHPGTGEIEWLVELKPRAERIGAEVFGQRIAWRVERKLKKSKTRSDVVIELEDGTVVITGEAKRPDDPRGVTPLLTDEVDDAVTKAQHQGARWGFTTNFHQIAVFDAGPGLMARPLSRLQGDVIEFIPRMFADSAGWWSSLTEDERDRATEHGLRTFFERCRLLGSHPLWY